MKKVEDYVRSIPDFPEPGIIFRDVTTILQDPDGLHLAVDGILDSLTITGIIALLTMEFGIMIPYEEIIEENFNSVAGLARMVEKLQA